MEILAFVLFGIFGIGIYNFLTDDYNYFERERNYKLREITTAEPLETINPSKDKRIVNMNGQPYELPPYYLLNDYYDKVSLKSILLTKDFIRNKSITKIPIGLSINYQPVITDIAEIYHLLIAGSSGGGKSVILNSIITSLLVNATPHDLQFVLIDTKRVELSSYEDIPHLYKPIVYEVEEAIKTLEDLIEEMETRYQILRKAGVKNITNYNKKNHMSRIICVFDEFADIIAQEKKQVEKLVTRLAQKGRAAGINLIIATQTPSADVLPTVIKNNFNATIGLKTESRIGSDLILKRTGLEKLVGKGHFLFSCKANFTEGQGCYIDEKEINRIVSHVKKQKNITDSIKKDTVKKEPVKKNLPFEFNVKPTTTTITSKKQPLYPSSDPKYFEVARGVINDHSLASATQVQKTFTVGWERAKRIIEYLRQQGILGEPIFKKPSKVLISLEEFEQRIKTD